MGTPLAEHGACNVYVFQQSEDREVQRKIRCEYEEMPGLRLTVDQACRFWALDYHQCVSQLDGLVEAGFLRRDEHGRYAFNHNRS